MGNNNCIKEREITMTINNEKIVKRWNSVMDDICLEYLTIGTQLSELEHQKKYYDVEDGISVSWMFSEASYWLSCYYESGNVRCDDKEYDYKTWLSETGKLKRLIARLEKMEDEMIVEW
jgi:predicted transcriptional regulator